MHTYGFFALGLIGGSLARSLKKTQTDCVIFACDQDEASLEKAKADRVVDRILTGPDDSLFSECDFIFLCAPAEANLKAMEIIGKHVSPGSILTDVGSVKTPAMEKAEALGLGSCFIGAHPMAGSEKSGYENSSDHLFENAYYILTPADEVSGDKLESYRSLVLSFRALPMVMKAQEHDYITAAISHLPHVIASALVNTVHDLDDSEEHMKAIAAGGFRDITRIASSSPDMWESVCVENAGNISRVMDTFLEKMAASKSHMLGGDGSFIHQMFEHSKDYRDSFSYVPSGPVKKAWRIHCDVIDESGAIATIATILAVHSISIKNIAIVHNRTYEQGALAIEFYEEDAMHEAVRILRHHRYTVWEND